MNSLFDSTYAPEINGNLMFLNEPLTNVMIKLVVFCSLLIAIILIIAWLLGNFNNKIKKCSLYYPNKTTE